MQQLSEEWKQHIEQETKRGVPRDLTAKQMIDAGYSMDFTMQVLGLSTGPNRDAVMNTLKYFGVKKIDLEGLDVFVCKDFLSSDECEYFIKWIDENQEPSKLGVEQKESESNIRQSSVAYATQLERNDKVFQALKLKITGLLGIPAQFTEAFQGQVYDEKGFYKPHFDVLDSDDPSMLRSWTLIINLNTVEEGGETEFPEFDFSIQAKQGQAIVFNSLDKYGCLNKASFHGGAKVLKGKKYIITQWFRMYDQYSGF